MLPEILVIVETKLHQSIKTECFADQLSNWKILKRYDSNDGKKNMGLILLTPRIKAFKEINLITHHNAKRNESLQIQGIIVQLKCDTCLGFLYCRSSPHNSEIDYIKRVYRCCKVLMGDFNLSHRIADHKRKLNELCETTKVSVLHEITRAISNNQLDYVIVDEVLKNCCFTTSYYNFISDHKSITLRIGLDGNKLKDEVVQRINFDEECHMKTKAPLGKSPSSTRISVSDISMNSESSNIESDMEIPCDTNLKNSTFKRRFLNVDGATCWLNSCLQSLLIAVDRLEDFSEFNSELGIEILRLKDSQEIYLDPTILKNIIVAVEDTRVSRQISEETTHLNNQIEIQRVEERILRQRFNLLDGQQCVRDLYLCLEVNLEDWPEICEMLRFGLLHSTTCIACNQRNTSETFQMFIELPVPPNGTSLNSYVEEHLNQSELVTMNCESGCSKLVQAEKRSELVSGLDARFLMVILSRAMDTGYGHQVNESRIIATEDVFVR